MSKPMVETLCTLHVLFTEPKSIFKTIYNYIYKLYKKAPATTTILGALICALLLLVIVRTVTGCPDGFTTVNEIEPVAAAAELTEEEILAEEAERGYIYKAEAEEMARVLFGSALHNTEKGQRLVCWCILNRVDSPLYPDNVIDVCKQEQQWMGYSEENPIIQNLYDVAVSVLDQYHGGAYRAMAPDYIFMSWSENEIILRDEFKETARTHYWHE